LLVRTSSHSLGAFQIAQRHRLDQPAESRVRGRAPLSVTTMAAQLDAAPRVRETGEDDVADRPAVRDSLDDEVPQSP